MEKNGRIQEKKFEKYLFFQTNDLNATRDRNKMRSRIYLKPGRCAKPNWSVK